jgi:hypothetical protein
MPSAVLVAALALILGCAEKKKEPEKVDNVATRYTESLNQNLGNAHDAAARANAAIAAGQAARQAAQAEEAQ